MFFLFISSRKDSSKQIKRAGGGGGGRGGGSSSSGGRSGSSSSGSGRGSSSSSGSSITGSRGSTSSKSSTVYGSSRSITPYSNGGGKQITIPQGQLFSGRTAGGATRNDIYGNRIYGSGYPGVSGRGVAGRGFPFYFWPVVWGGAAGAGSYAYLHDTEYGNADNSSRPGGAMMTAAFQSNSTSTIFRILSDNNTVVDLVSDIHANCSSHLTSDSASSASSVFPYNASASDAPKPEQVVQYYRASSVSLTLDGYNNSAALETEGAPDASLPSGIDASLLDCLNTTIAVSVPLVDAGVTMWSTPSIGFLGVVWVGMLLLRTH